MNSKTLEAIATRTQDKAEYLFDQPDTKFPMCEMLTMD